MKNRKYTRRVAATIGIAAAISAGALTACGGGESSGAVQHHDDDHDHHRACAVALTHREEHQPHRRQPLHPAGEGTAGTYRGPRRQLDNRRTGRASHRLARPVSCAVGQSASSASAGANDLMCPIAEFSAVCMSRGS